MTCRRGHCSCHRHFLSAFQALSTSTTMLSRTRIACSIWLSTPRRSSTGFAREPLRSHSKVWRRTLVTRDGGSFPDVSTWSKPTSSLAAVVRNAITASSLAGAVITGKTVSRSGTARTSSTGAGSVSIPRGPVKSVGELTGYMAEEPVVVYTGVKFQGCSASSCGRTGKFNVVSECRPHRSQ